LANPAANTAPPDSTQRPRVAFVVQRCGEEVNGGAEWHCLQVAQRMSAHWETEVLTTCARDYMTWENFYPAGAVKLGGTSVRRFPVDRPRDVEDFNQLSATLQRDIASASIAAQEEWMRAQGPISTALLEYLAAEKESYDAFIFFTYLYATTYFGLPLVREKAYLAPLAHDEWPIYFSMWERLFSLPQRFIFNTEWEERFLRERFPDLSLAGTITGVGIEQPRVIESERFRDKYNLHEPFLLYVGRIDAAKGCAEMFDYFLRWREQTGANRKLVLLGMEVLAVPFHDDVVHLGFVPEDEKWQAMASCDWLWMPSVHESLSMVLLETWSAGRPAIVTGACGVLRAHCERSHGGLWYEGYDDWRAILETISDDEKQQLGRQGMAYVRDHYSWSRVEQDYLALTPGRARKLVR
jgi:glycosyltransferase involved in cell wall biosynthesis